MSQVYDYVLDCVDCGQMYVFGTDEERSRERDAHHSTHEVDYFRQARV